MVRGRFVFTARTILALVFAVWLPAPAAVAAARGEVIRLIPEQSAGWSMRNVLAPLRAGHFYGERKIEVESTPPGATIDLFYVRSGFQLRYEQAQAPVTVMLPSRIKATGKDSVTIRAFLDGYRQRETTVRVSSDRDRVLLELDPLPNALEAVAHTYFAGRASLSFLTEEAPTIRMQEARRGFSVILAETAGSEQAAAALEGIRSPLVERVSAQQLGEDLVVRVRFEDGAEDEAVDLRSRQSHDPIRRLHSYTVDFVPVDRGAAYVERARAVIAGLGPADVLGCELVYDEALRAELDPAALSRALTPSGRFTDPYLRAAMRRLGEISPDGVIALLDDTQLRPAAPIELTAAMTQASQAKGYLALLRSLVAGLEQEPYRRSTLRSLIAPETSPDVFDEILDRVESRLRACRSGS